MNDPLSIGNRAVVMSVSGGSGSAVALLKLLEHYPAASVVGVFANTQTEAADLYRFLDDLESHTGLTFVRLDQGMDIWDCFERYGVMKMHGAYKASVELKIKPLVKWVQAHYTPEQAVVASGMSWMEPERQDRMKMRWDQHGYGVVHPLNLSPKLSDCEEKEYLQQRGLTPPNLYDKGYPHNNCGGGCILAGMGQWAGFYRDFPEQFAYHERREQAFFDRTGFTILKDRRGGQQRPLTLRQLRERVDAGETFRDFRTACNCMMVATDEDAENAAKETGDG